jgi:hypothetical protein
MLYPANTGVPFYSINQLHEIATQFLHTPYVTYGSGAQKPEYGPLDVELILQRLDHDVLFLNPLPHSLGIRCSSLLAANGTVFVFKNESVADNPNGRALLAHELAHVILHWDLLKANPDALNNLEPDFFDLAEKNTDDLAALLLVHGCKTDNILAKRLAPATAIRRIGYANNANEACVRRYLRLYKDNQPLLNQKML